jgi:hypothetical protein
MSKHKQQWQPKITLIASMLLALNCTAALSQENTAQHGNAIGQDDSTSLGQQNVVHHMPYSTKDCAADVGLWSLNAYNCSGDLPGATASTSILIEDYHGAGSAQFSCNGSNAYWELVQGSQDCAAPPQCSPSPVSWSVKGNACTASISGNTANSIVTADSTAAGYSGQAQFECVPTSKNTAPQWQNYDQANWTCAVAVHHMPYQVPAN